MPHQCDHNVHALDSSDSASLHDLSGRNCHCGPLIEIVEENGCETFFIFHNQVRKMDEAKDLRELLQKCEGARKEGADRITKAIEYLELIKTDYVKSTNEMTLIETTLSYLRD